MATNNSTSFYEEDLISIDRRTLESLREQIRQLTNKVRELENHPLVQMEREALRAVIRCADPAEPKAEIIHQTRLPGGGLVIDRGNEIELAKSEDYEEEGAYCAALVIGRNWCHYELQSENGDFVNDFQSRVMLLREFEGGQLHG